MVYLKPCAKRPAAPSADRPGPAGVTWLHDFLIIGGGVAGLAAALFGRRKHLNTLLVERSDRFGGHLQHSYGAKPVVDYPGFPEGILGHDLVRRFVDHARQEGADLRTGQTVQRVEKWAPGFRVHTAEGQVYDALCLLIAIGTVPRRLGLPNERQFANRSLFYSLNSPDEFAGKRVLVVGGGNSALEVAMGLQCKAGEVCLIHRSRFRADESLQHEFLATGVPYELGLQVAELHGDGDLTAVTLRNVETGEEQRRPVDAVIICTGLSPAVGYLEELGIAVNDRGFIVVDQDCRTNVPGVLAAGDITGGVARLAIAVGQGVTAGHTAHQYVRGLQANAPARG